MLFYQLDYCDLFGPLTTVYDIHFQGQIQDFV